MGIVQPIRRTAVTDDIVSSNDNIEQMSSNADDIVTSLRASAEWIKDYEHESWFEIADLQVEAANEIERLQEELNTTQELLARCYKLAVWHGPDFDVFDDWEEAVSAYERDTHRA
jgi:hypothetical protein